MHTIQHNDVLSAIGLGTLVWLGVSSLQSILYRYGYARGREEGARDAASTTDRDAP